MRVRTGTSECRRRRRRVKSLAQRIYVGNLPYEARESEVEELFAAHGEVISVALPTDRETGRARGFGFVEMADEDATKAISALDGSTFQGRRLNVDAARGRAAAAAVAAATAAAAVVTAAVAAVVTAAVAVAVATAAAVAAATAAAAVVTAAVAAVATAAAVAAAGTIAANRSATVSTAVRGADTRAR